MHTAKYPARVKNKGEYEAQKRTRVQHPTGIPMPTICEASTCPNEEQCLANGTVNFMLMGEICTRNCGICNLAKGNPEPLDDSEPDRLAETVSDLQIKHVVISSVTRDDLPDEGAGHLYRAIKGIQSSQTAITIEVILPDFVKMEDLKKVTDCFPDVINCNLICVPSLYGDIRPESDYKRLISALNLVKELNPGIITKSSLMLGLGELDYEVLKVMEDLREAECNCLTLGQYFPPSTNSYDIHRFVSPEEYFEYQSIALQMGFSSVRCGSFVRSHYDAVEMYREVAQ